MPGGTELPSAGAPTVADSVFSENESNEPQARVAWLAELERCARSDLPKVEALSQIDALQRRLFEALRHAYGDYQAKLFALKLGNYAVAKYHFVNRHVKVVSRPVTLMHDPSNACQLQCPACVHTDNAEYKKDMLWPAATMKVTAFDRALRGIGPFAFNVVYYNYGEPLLNKDLPELLRISNGYGLSSCFSTNLSLKFDVERFVAAAPEHVILSIDGVTQATYGRYRKRGNLALVLENVKALVAAKKKLGKNRPFLSWRMFTFEHNVHEVEQAMVLAREMGVDEIEIGTPFDVSLDDPGVKGVRSEHEGHHALLPWTPRDPDEAAARLVRHDEVERVFDESWVERARSLDLTEPSHRASSTCIWLYFSVSLDAAQRLMPCCMAPTRDRPLVYGNLAQGVADPFNLAGFTRSRLAFADRPRFEVETAGESSVDLPYCSRCNEAPTLTYEPRAVVADIEAMDHRGVLGRDAESLRALAIW